MEHMNWHRLSRRRNCKVFRVDKRRERRVARKWGKSCPDSEEKCPVCKAWYYFYVFNMIL